MAEKKKYPSKAEMDEMDDFGQYISWMLKNNPKGGKKEEEKPAGNVFRSESKRMIEEEKKRKAKK